MSVRAQRLPVALIAMLLAFAPSIATSAPIPPPRSDSVVIAASARYRAGGFRRWLLGNTYRDAWSIPVRVPVLNLRTFAGGLRPVKEGSGKQTKSLRLINPDGTEYVFRLVDKFGVQTPKRFKGTIVDKMFRDQISSSHPGAALVAAPILDAARVLHVTPILAVLPDDSLLGKFRTEFAGKLGMIEEYPGTPKHGEGFAGAHKIIDSDELEQRIDSDPAERIDARAFLAARLTDMLLNDWDRHWGQWKWARLHSGDGNPWEPIPRDRDKAFVNYDGWVDAVARHAAPNLTLFEGTYASVRALTVNSFEFDRRLLSGLEKPVWDSVAAELVRRITDSVIDHAMLALPPEYRSVAPQWASKLKQRRDGLPAAANRFYYVLAAVEDIHGTDAADQATIARVDDRTVEVRLAGSDGSPYFDRRFDARETREIRVYLHGGDDSVFVTGKVQHSIPVRVIGGNGTNRLIDASTVGGHGHRAHLYDAGSVKGIEYPKEDSFFNRRPLVREFGHKALAGRDWGSRSAPTIGISINRDYGIVPILGLRKYKYAFRKRPYSSMVGLQAEYSTNVGGFRVTLTKDKRLESSPWHFLFTARMSQLEVINFFGFGNQTPGIVPGFPTAFYDARDRQWLVQPALGLALGRRTDVSLGPVAQYTVTDSNPDRLLSLLHPYGMGNFGEAGVRLNLHHDSRDVLRDPRRGLLLDVTGSYYPALWDVASQFGSVAGGAVAYLTFPVPIHPVLVLRAGGKKVYGKYPYFEAAFVGGRSMLRSLDAQRYAGDAAMYGSAELRLPLKKFAFILPWDVGIFGVVDAGRVYYQGDSPGGWHETAGVGFWIGVPDPSTAVRVCRRFGASGPC